MIYWLVYLVVLVAGFALGVGIFWFVHRRWRGASSEASASWVKTLVENLIIVLLTIFLTFMAAEFYFKVFFAQTDSFSFTLANRNWFDRYWHFNSLGFRDVEWTPEYVQNKRKILAVGDSFAAGYGIKQIEDRYSNVLNRKLGDEYVVMNGAIPGSSTADEIRRISKIPYKPDIVIWQYYLNDIRQAAEQKDAVFNRPISEPWPIFRPLVDNSYALNFLYWRLVRMGPAAWDNSYMAWMKGAYNDPDIWWLHQEQLLTVYNGASSENVQLIVVVFPSLLDIEGSREVTDKIVAFFRERDVPVLDVADLLEGVPPKEMVVNSFDSHPNEWAHELIADKLYEMVIQLDKDVSVAK